ncbi:MULTISPECIES: hypothetical protein [Leuconostoc]|uniref:hypothetical protein n=1 Tax=Leuconostoc TaxID=1243 RepID=UPI00166711BC|nr:MULTISPECIES: hypothetical protein [Leuconostoc]MCM6827046.1 hypothetical protein [Leuconostoc mesenteroides]
MNKLKNISQYIPFVLIVLGVISTTVGAFMVSKPFGFIVSGSGLFGLAYILAPKGGQS